VASKGESGGSVEDGTCEGGGDGEFAGAVAFGVFGAKCEGGEDRSVVDEVAPGEGPELAESESGVEHEVDGQGNGVHAKGGGLAEGED
jgi:hypothetical protein